MINTQQLELPLSRKTFHGSKDVQAIEVQQYDFFFFLYPKVLKYWDT